MNQKLNGTIAPWYRHRWPWLLMLGPVIVVLAGTATAYLAFRSNDGLVDDDYYKQGLAVNQVTTRERRARELDLSAELSFDKARGLIHVVVRSNKLPVFPEALKLTITHPTRSGQDQSLVLQRADASANGVGIQVYAAGLPGMLSGRWRIGLEDDKREWRLADDWAVDMQPVLTLPVINIGATAGPRVVAPSK